MTMASLGLLIANCIVVMLCSFVDILTIVECMKAFVALPIHMYIEIACPRNAVSSNSSEDYLSGSTLGFYHEALNLFLGICIGAYMFKPCMF